MINEIKVVYVDDQIDTEISGYLLYHYCNVPYSLEPSISKKYVEKKFENISNYVDFFNTPDIRTANIILIDNRLFQNNSIVGQKFTGAEFKIFLKKVFPFIEVIIITQNDDMEKYGIIKKHLSGDGISGNEYYNKILAPVLDDLIRNILLYNDIVDELKKKNNNHKMLIEKISSSLEGNDTFDELTKEDINSIVKTFQELKQSIENEK